MKKAAKKIISIAFAFVLLITSLLPVAFSAFSFKKANVIEASAAADDSALERFDSNFEFIDGASIYVKSGASGSELVPRIKFRLMITNEEQVFDKFDNEKDVWEFSFQVMRKGKTSDVHIYTQHVIMYKNGIILGHYKPKVKEDGLLVGDIALQKGAVTLSPTQGEGATSYITLADLSGEGRELTEKEAAVGNIMREIVQNVGKTFDSFSVHEWDVPIQTKTDPDYNFPLLDLEITVNSPSAEYYVRFDYKLEDFKRTETPEWWEFWESEKDVYDVTKGSIKSPSRSVIEVLRRMEAAGDLDKAFSGADLETVNYLLGNTVDKSVTVQYLERIGATPFAHKVEKVVEIPVTNGYAHSDDIEFALGKEIECLGASTKGVFPVDSFNVCKVEYLYSVACEAQTVDANRTDMYYLSLNRSFGEYYDGMVTSGIFEQGAADVMLNGIKKDYPATENYSKDELHGLWGYLVVPQTNSLNSIFRDIFNLPPDFTGNIVSATTNGKLSLQSYNKLLGDYNYGWLSRAWQDVLQGLDGSEANCTHYFFYADPKYRETTVDESGSGLGSDNGAAMEGVQEGVTVILDGVKKKVNETKRSLERTVRVMLGIVTLGAAIVGGVYLVKVRKRSNS